MASSTAFKKFIPLEIKPVLVGAKRKRSGPVVYAPILHASEFNYQDVHVHPVNVYGAKNIKNVKLSPVKYKGKMTKMPVRIQLSGGGDLPFGVQTNQFGGTDVSVGINSSAELKNILLFEESMLHLACENKRSWWPNNPNMTDLQVEENFARIIIPGKLKNASNPDEGKWPSRMKLRIPINSTTGEPNAERMRAGQKVCKINDSDGSIISIHDLEHREWDTIIFDFNKIWFKGKFTWSIGAKECSMMKLIHDEDADVEYQEVHFVPKPDCFLPDTPKAHPLDCDQETQDEINQIQAFTKELHDADAHSMVVRQKSKKQKKRK